MKTMIQGFMGKSKKKQKGMTLVELLAVIVILGIVAAIGTIAIGNIIENSREEAKVRTVEMIEEAAKMYYLDNADNDSATWGTNVDISDYYDGDSLDDYTVGITSAGVVTVTPAP